MCIESILFYNIRRQRFINATVYTATKATQNLRQRYVLLSQTHLLGNHSAVKFVQKSPKGFVIINTNLKKDKKKERKKEKGATNKNKHKTSRKSKLDKIYGQGLYVSIFYQRALPS